MMLQALVKTQNGVEMEKIDINKNNIINLEDLSRYLSFKKRFNGNFKFFCENKEFEKNQNVEDLDLNKILFCEGNYKEKKIMKINNYYTKCAITQIYKKFDSFEKKNNYLTENKEIKEINYLENKNLKDKNCLIKKNLEDNQNLLEKRKIALQNEKMQNGVKKIKIDMNKNIAGFKNNNQNKNLIEKKVFNNELQNISNNYKKFKEQNLENTKEYFETQKNNFERIENNIKLDMEKFKKMNSEEKNKKLKNKEVIYRLIKFDKDGSPAITENLKGSILKIEENRLLIKNNNNEENLILLNNIYSILINPKNENNLKIENTENNKEKLEIENKVKLENGEEIKKSENEKTTKANSIRLQKQNADNLLKLEISKQISYYFSDKNYYKDKYINTQIKNDRDNAFRIKLFMTFNRIKNFCVDFKVLKQALVEFESHPDCNYVFVTSNKIVKKNLAQN